MIGIGGGVAAGKSTVAAELGRRWGNLGRRVEIVATDAFLFPNAVLAERSLVMRKGFPESYDSSALLGFVGRVRSGGRVEVPVYSHATYDIVAGERVVLEDPDLVILEGVIAVQAPLVNVLDLSIYVDADEAAMRRWFVSRFIGFVAAAAEEAGSFYKMFVGLADDEVVRIAEATWDGINGVNLCDHILPERSRATFVVRKGPDHAIESVERG